MPSYRGGSWIGWSDLEHALAFNPAHNLFIERHNTAGYFILTVKALFL
jgi:hypothetical protein